MFWSVARQKLLYRAPPPSLGCLRNIKSMKGKTNRGWGGDSPRFLKLWGSAVGNLLRNEYANVINTKRPYA
jgi:hypothetical protein